MNNPMFKRNIRDDHIPKVSVVIPAYRLKYLEAALRSVLEQDFTDYEIVICDDSQKDEIHDFISDFFKEADFPPVVYSKNEGRLYGGGTLSRCISLARGTYIKPVFDDDILLQGCLSAFVDVLDRHSDVSLVTSRRTLIDENGRPLPDSIATTPVFDENVCVHGRDLISFLADLTLNFIGEPTCIMFRARHIQPEVGRLYHLGDQAIQWVGDLAMNVKLLRHGHMAFLSHSYSSFRVSKEQLSQLGRDRPGIGEKGHNDFRRLIRELGWCRSVNNHLVRVRPLADKRKGFAPLDLADRIRSNSDRLRPAVTDSSWGVAEWIRDRTPSEARILAVQTMLRANPDVGTIGVVIIFPEGASIQDLVSSLESVGVQHRPVEALWIVGKDVPDEAAGDGIELIRGDGAWAELVSRRIAEGSSPDFLWFLHAGDRLMPHATVLFGEYRLRQPNPLVWYTDECQYDNGVPIKPILKPDFNIDLLRSYPYIGRNLVVSSAAIHAAGGLDSRVGNLAALDLIWRLVENVGPGVVGHVPEVLQISAIGLLDWIQTAENLLWFPVVIQTHFVRLGIEVELEPGPILGCQRVVYPLPVRPLVSIIIPTRDQLPVFRACLEGILENTSYPEYEILIIDNGSVEADAVTFLAGLESVTSDQVRVLRWQDPFNFAAMNNYAVQHARGDVLLFLNNDIQFSPATRKDWLDRLLRLVLRSEAGVVGSRLDLPDGTVDSAGLVLGMDNSVGAAFHGLSAARDGYMNRLVVQQNVSAISGSCLMVRREVFEELEGFDEASFPIYYADVDLCMKASQAGYLLVLEPDTGLQHMGGATRLLTEKFGLDARPDDMQRDRLYARWLPKLARDPNYHPAFGKHSPGFDLSPEASRIHEPLPGRPLPVVLAAHADWHGCGHYRILHPFKAMADELRLEGGLKLNDFHFTDVARIQPDVIVLQGAWAHAGILTQIRRYREITGAKVVLEFDDYLPNVPTRSIYRKQFSRSVLRDMRRAIEQVDWLVVSTPALAEEYSSFHHDIRVAPNGLLPGWWRNLDAQRRSGRKMRVGWAGGVSHTGDLAEIRSVVKDLGHEVEWVFMGMKPNGVQCEFHPGVAIDRYPAKLASLNLDLAVVPLEVNQFNRCKSNLRLLELGACGIPVICTDIEPYRGDLPVTRVRNRYHDWVEAIRAHISDPDALARSGDALRDAVLNHWMLEGDFLNQWQYAWVGDTQ